MVSHDSLVGSRRNVLKASATLGTGLVAGCLGGLSGGGEYPNDTLEWVVPYEAGSGLDSWARGLFPPLSDEMGAEHQIRNIPGSGGLRGLSEVQNADPDGHTLTTFSLPLVPIAYEAQQPNWELSSLRTCGVYAQLIQVLMFANPELGIESVEDLFQRYRSGELTTIGSSNVRSLTSAVAFVLKHNDDYNVAWENLVEYDSSGSLMQAVASGEVPVGLANNGAVLGGGFEDQVDVVSSVSSMTGPGVSNFVGGPTFADTEYPPMDTLGTYIVGIYTPPETPDDINQTVWEGMQAVQDNEDFQGFLNDTGLEAGPWVNPEEHRQMFEESISTIRDELPAAFWEG